MINSMREHGLQDPEFGIYGQFFRVILKNQASNLRPVTQYSDLNQRQIKIIEFLKKNKSVKMKMCMKINNVSFGTARLDINELIKFKYIKKVGSYRGAYYIFLG